MSKQSLLLVDGDTRSLRVLEVSLRKAGFMVTAALSVQDALDKLELHAPDLIISETTFPDGDGFDLRRRVRATPDWAEIPFIFLTAEAAIENKIRGLELGVDDYLTKPIYIKEIVTRINILLQKRQRVRFEERRDGRTRFAGRVQDMPVVDVIQTIEISRKSGVIQFVGERGRQAAIYFRDGRVIDAEAGSLQGEDAVYRLLTWNEGEFEVVFRTVRRREVITKSSQALLMEGMRRLDEWSRLFEQLPPLTHRFEVDTIELAGRLGDVPDDNNRILRLVDGKRTLLEVIDGSDVGDLECLQAISRLYFEELLIDLDQGADHGKTPRRDTGKAAPLLELDGANAGEETSGPVAKGANALDESDAAFSEGGLEDLGPGAAGGAARGDAARAHGDAAEANGRNESEVEPIGPLQGGYRPSSLRLIDEAVAAAQAIEPSLFDDDASGGRSSSWRGGDADGKPRSVNGSGAAAFERAPAAATAGDRNDAGTGDLERGTGDLERGPGDLERGPGDWVQTSADASDGSNHEAAATRATAEREESGLKMIGSLGRDRAEASGELAPLGQARPLRSETARELVTILPRRVTREMPVVSHALGDSLPAATPTPTSPVRSARAAAGALGEAGQRGAAGSGLPESRRTGRIVQLVHSIQDSGPGFGALLLIVLALMLAGTAVFLRLRRPTTGAPAQSEPLYDARGAATRAAARPSAALGVAAGDAAESRRATGNAASGGARAGATPPVGAAGTSVSAGPSSPGSDGASGGVSDAAAVRALRGLGPRAGEVGAAPGEAVPGSGALGAAVAGGGQEAGGAAGMGARSARVNGASSPAAGAEQSSPSAEPTGAVGPDNASRSAGRDVRADRTIEAKSLCDRSSDALDEGDAAHALELATASLKLRRTTRGYLLRARAEQRLGRVDAALRSLDAATEFAPNLAAIWEQRGRILWTARRRDEARVAFARFLDLAPNSPNAVEIQRMISDQP